jgi:hypothetical protein
MQVFIRSSIMAPRTDFSVDHHLQRRRSWTRCLEVLLLVLLGSCTTVRNPNVCCISDSECAQLGLPPGSVSEYGTCSEGRVCRDFYCVEPPVPIVDNGQPAELVLGQETFTWAEQNYGGISARALYWPTGITVDDAGRLWVLDTGNCRALMWSPAPTTSFAEAALVVGSPDFTSISCSCTGSRGSIGAFGALGAYRGKLLIPAAGCNHVKVWNPVPTADGAEASTALGQVSFYDSLPGNEAGDFERPSGVWTDGTRVAVADTQNSRVLIWTSFPRLNKEPADIVLGQQGFGASGFPTTPTGATMRSPSFVYSDGVRFFVSDTGNNRVLMWRSFPTTSGQPADLAIGQPDLTSDGIGYGGAQLAHPFGIAVTGDHLFVADHDNYRILIFGPIPTASGAHASFVLGQPDFETTNPSATQHTLSGPSGLAVDGNKLYVADLRSNRVLRFNLRL